jgi:hypothetical protein
MGRGAFRSRQELARTAPRGTCPRTAGQGTETVKLPEAVWRELRAAAERHGVTVNGVLIALGQELVSRSALDATIDRLIEERLLVPSASR